VFFCCGLFWAAGAVSGRLLIWGRCSGERHTGKSACATERLRTLVRGRQELAIVLRRYAGTGRNACATGIRRYYSTVTADMLLRRH
jgi:hypothetical protein